MCGCGTASWCAGGCECGCDHATLAGQRRQAQHFALQYKDMQGAVQRAEKRGFDNGVLYECGRITEALEGLRKTVAFSRKPGYRQGFVGCLTVVRDMVRRKEEAPARGTP